MSSTLTIAPTTTAEIESVLSALITDWNRHDMAAHTALFHPTADFVNVVGMHKHGRQEIEEMHMHLHRTIFGDTTLRDESHTVRFLSPTIALAHVNWDMTGAQALPGWEPGTVRRGVMTLVLTEEDHRWLVTAAHNTDVVPISMPASGCALWHSGAYAQMARDPE
jgi:uncharacterized protein (TIGR02246 family)